MEITLYYTVSEVAAMRSIFPAVAFISVLLLSAVAGALFVGLAEANGIFVSPDMFTEPPTITILSTSVNGNNVTINFKANVGKSATAVKPLIDTVICDVDWNQNRTYVYRHYNWDENVFDTEQRTEVYCNFSETAVPDGNHTVTIYASEMGYYEGRGTFHITGFSSVNFTVDTVPPNVSVLSVENIAYDLSDTALNFTVSEKASKISYALDCQRNVTINGNTTLTGLTYGSHNVTVYAWDIAGNVAASETITFTITEPFPVVPVAAASVASVAVVGVGLLVYFKKRKR